MVDSPLSDLALVESYWGGHPDWLSRAVKAVDMLKEKYSCHCCKQLTIKKECFVKICNQVLLGEST